MRLGVVDLERVVFGDVAGERVKCARATLSDTRRLFALQLRWIDCCWLVFHEAAAGRLWEGRGKAVVGRLWREAAIYSTLLEAADTTDPYTRE